MKFVKTIYKHEYSGERVTPFGIVRFNREGVCAIQDDDLAQAVADCSQSLVLADEADESIVQLLAKLKSEDENKNKPVDAEAIGKFISSADNGAVVKSTKVEEAQKEIGSPAGETSEGSFSPNVDAAQMTEKPQQIIGSPVEEAKSVSLLDETGAEINKAPIAKTEETISVDSNEAIRVQLGEFKVSEIKEMLAEGGVEESKFKGLKKKEDLIEVAINSKILD